MNIKKNHKQAIAANSSILVILKTMAYIAELIPKHIKTIEKLIHFKADMISQLG